jgi:hypothetical protein
MVHVNLIPAMPKAFLTSKLSDTETGAIASASSAQPRREEVTVMVFGSVHSSDRLIRELYRLGFAEVTEWSKPQPTAKAQEVVRVLTRYVIAR